MQLLNNLSISIEHLYWCMFSNAIIQMLNL